MKIRLVVTSAAALAAGFLVAVAPGGVADASTCTPSINVLSLLGGSSPQPDLNRVEGIGYGSLSVGTSGLRPVYWTGTVVHAVPLPAGYSYGEVRAVNSHNLMVGRLISTDGYTQVAFRYQAGAAAATVLPGTDAVALNDSGRILGVDSVGVVEWVGTSRVRYFNFGTTTSSEPFAISNAGVVTTKGQNSADGSGTFGGLSLVWPADRTLAPTVIATDNTEEFWEPAAIADGGRIVGRYRVDHSGVHQGVYWTPPYTSGPKELAPLAGRFGGGMNAISPGGSTAAGTAVDGDYDYFPPESGPAPQAVVWSGSGPVLALPRLAAGQASAAYAASASGRVGGSAVNATGNTRAVVWQCALAQAYVPAG